MNLSEDFELLESLFVELDPLEDSFAGVIVEVHRHGDRYVLLETAPATGNHLLALHQNSGSDTRSGSSVLNKLPLLVVACNFGAKPHLLRFSSKDRKLVYTAFDKELGGQCF